MTDSTMVVLGMTSFALVVVLYVWFALALAAMFRKMAEPTWRAWVPVLNVATVLKRGDFSPWLVLLNVVPLFGAIAFIIVFIVAVHRITTAFGRGAGLTVVGALVPVVWASILGWGSSRWSGLEGAGPVDERSGPLRRGGDRTPAYVPLVGGWTPEPAATLDGRVPEEDRWSPFASDDRRTSATQRGGWIPDAVGPPHAPTSAREEGEPASFSQPIAMPFAVPSFSLADVVPAPTDSAPRAEAVSPPVDDRSDGGIPAERSSSIPDGSVFAVLDALRDDPHRDAAGLRRGRTADRRGMPSGGDAEQQTPVAHGMPTGRGRGGSDSAVAPVPEQRESEQTGTGPDPLVAPWISPPRRTPTADAEGGAPAADVPLTRPSPETAVISRPAVVVPAEEFPELSEAVSAVAEAPEAGAPRSARTSVSSLYAQPTVPEARDDGGVDDVDVLDRTVVTRRKRIRWMLVPPSGTPVALTSDIVILGRRPAPDAAHPDAQLVAIGDETRTVSKTHARLQLRGETWYVTDLDSTNGVLFATLMGTEVEAPRGEEIEAGSRFFLGDAEVRLTRSDA